LHFQQIFYEPFYFSFFNPGFSALAAVLAVFFFNDLNEDEAEAFAEWFSQHYIWEKKGEEI